MPSSTKLKLLVFMFLQYYVWGSWFPSMGTYLAHTLKFSGAQIGAAYGAFAIGAIISPFFVGMIADRFFAAEKVLAVLGVAGGGALLALAHLGEFNSFYAVLIAYCALFVPTLAVGNSLAMQHLADVKSDFPRIKIASAIGWVAASVTVSALKAEQSHIQFYLAGAASVVFGAYALALPHTPPKPGRSGSRLGQLLGLDALGLLRKRSFALFVACMFLISIPLKCYHVMLSIYLTELQWTNVAGKMALAQVSDVVGLFVMPFMLRRWGYKLTILAGILAWVVRYAFLAQSLDLLAWQSALVYAAILLHGICYDFLFIAGQMYVNAEADDSNRSAAQGLIAFVLWGVGTLAGTLLAGKLLAANRYAEAIGTLHYNWYWNWMIPAIFAAGVMIVFGLLFREPAKKS